MGATFPTVERPPPATGTALDNWLNRAYIALRGAVAGKLNALLDVTLTANSGTTVVQDPRLSGMSFLHFCPLTATAAAELGSGVLYVSAQDAYTATLTHANDPSTDRTFRILIIG